MKISKQCRKFHDPWGNKYGNRKGQTIRFQYMVGLGSIYEGNDGSDVHSESMAIDKVRGYEHNGNRFVRGSKRSSERLRR
jgi:hypothetical protein